MGNESGMPDLSGLLSGLMSNPQALSLLSSLLGQMQTQPTPPPPPSSPACAYSLPQHCPTPCPPPPCEKKREDCEDKRRKLLLALKPFLSHERQEAVDRILMVEEALTLFYRNKGQGGKGTCT